MRKSTPRSMGYAAFLFVPMMFLHSPAGFAETPLLMAQSGSAASPPAMEPAETGLPHGEENTNTVAPPESSNSNASMGTTTSGAHPKKHATHHKHSNSLKNTTSGSSHSGSSNEENPDAEGNGANTPGTHSMGTSGDTRY